MIKQLHMVMPIGTRNQQDRANLSKEIPELDIGLIGINVPQENAEFVKDFLERRLSPLSGSILTEDSYACKVVKIT